MKTLIPVYFEVSDTFSRRGRRKSKNRKHLVRLLIRGTKNPLVALCYCKIWGHKLCTHTGNRLASFWHPFWGQRKLYGSIHLKDELSFWDELFRPQGKFSGQIFALRTKYFGLEWHFILRMNRPYTSVLKERPRSLIWNFLDRLYWALLSRLCKGQSSKWKIRVSL